MQAKLRIMIFQSLTFNQVVNNMFINFFKKFFMAEEFSVKYRKVSKL